MTSTDAAATFTFVNLRNDASGSGTPVQVLLTGDSISGVSGIVPGVATPLSSLSNASFSLQSISNGRLYVGLGNTLPVPPTPTCGTYYGYIELSLAEGAQTASVNLSNVEVLGLPLSLSGTQLAGTATSSFSLGYKTAMTPMMINGLRNSVLKKAGVNAIVTTSTGEQMGISPAFLSQAYQLMDTYVDSLATAGAPVSIASATLPDGTAETFTGAFQKAAGNDGVVLHLTGDQGDTMALTRTNLASSIIYRCGGGALMFNGKAVLQVQKPKSGQNGLTLAQTISNSVFASLMTGLNEGYFTTAGPNDSTTFSSQTPFANGQGNLYAQFIYNNSNAYGYACASSQLKTVIAADISNPVTVTILTDTSAYGYTAPASTSGSSS